MSAVILPAGTPGQPYSQTIKIQAGDAPFALANVKLPGDFSATIVPFAAAETGYGVRISGTSPNPATNLTGTLSLASAGGCSTDVTVSIPGGGGAVDCVAPSIGT